MSTGKLSGKLDEMLEGNLANKWHPIQGRSNDTPSLFML